jgi:hypothetical protein
MTMREPAAQGDGPIPQTRKWQIAGAGVAAAALGAVGITAASGDEANPRDVDTIELHSPTSTTGLEAPVAVDAPAHNLLSPDGESLDSPLQSADDSPEGADSVDTPGDSPHDSPAPAGVDSPASVDSP